MPRITAIGCFAANAADAAAGMLRMPAHRPRKAVGDVGCSDPAFYGLRVGWRLDGGSGFSNESSTRDVEKAGTLVLADVSMTERTQQRFWTIGWKRDGSISRNDF